MLRIVSALVILLISQSVFSNTIAAINQAPHTVHVFPANGMFVFYATVTSGTLPSCSGDNRWAVNTDKPGAKELISMVIAAKVSGRTIHVHGSGNCDPSGFGYEINYLQLN